MTVGGDLPEQSKDAAIEALLQVKDEQLIAELGERVGMMDFDSSYAGREALAPAPGFSPEGFSDDVLALGNRIFERASRDMYAIVCGDALVSPDDKRAVMGALSERDGVLAGVISTVLVSSMGLAPVVATVASALIVKRVFRNNGANFCEAWAASVGEPAQVPVGQLGATIQSVPVSASVGEIDQPVFLARESRGGEASRVPVQARAEPFVRKRADGRISLDELFELVRDRDVARADLEKYFRVDVARSGAFAPKLEINTDLVLPIQLESSAAAGIANFFSKADRQNRYTEKVEKMEGDFLRLVSEGDSWFQYPVYLEDVIDKLFDRYPIFSLGEAGAELGNMIGEGLDDIIAQKQAHGLLFSGGGNDLLGASRLKIFLRTFDESLQPHQYINATFDEFQKDIRENYKTLFDRLFSKFPDLRIFCHGYDYAIPLEKGKWLGQPMEDKGIVEKKLQQEIIQVVVDYHNAMMSDLAQTYGGRVIFVDCRGLMNPKTEWYDELHPTDAGYARVANLFEQNIDAVFGRRA